MKTIVFLLIAGVLAAVGLVGCGGGTGGSTSSVGTTSSGSQAAADSSDEGSEPVNVTLVTDATGAGGFAGAAVAHGAEYGVEQLNASKRLGNKTINLNVVDSASQSSLAASAVSKAASSDADVVMYAPLAPGAAATAPVAQKAKIPYISIAGNQPNLLDTGNFIFHSSAPPESYVEAHAKYWAQKGVKTMAMIYDTDNSSYVALNRVWQEAAPKNGITITSTVGITSTDTDLTAVATKVAEEDPDAVYAGTLGNQANTLLTQLSRAGWKGPVGGVYGIVYSLPELGALANEVSFSTDFSPASSAKLAREFAKGYEEESGEPLLGNLEAEGYDAVVGMLAKAIENAPEISREGIREGLEDVVKQGFDGATGEVTFGPGPGGATDAQVEGIVVEWMDGKQKVVLGE